MKKQKQGTRKIDGKIFELKVSCNQIKTSAKEEAKKMRKMGKKVRIIKSECGYDLYVQKT